MRSRTAPVCFAARTCATVDLEQQADCVAGAWAGRANAGLAPGITFGDNDVRAGLISMISIEDPIGTDPIRPVATARASTASAPSRSVSKKDSAAAPTLIDDPLPLTPILFTHATSKPGGNAPFGFGEDELFDFILPDLNLSVRQRPRRRVPRTSASSICWRYRRRARSPVRHRPASSRLGVELCSETDTVYLNEPIARQLYDDFGDFGPAYLLGLAWAEHAQNTSNSSLVGEARQLQQRLPDGAWVRSVIPVLDENGRPVLDAEGFPTLPEPRDPDRRAQVSDGDLTEAILTAIVIGDRQVDLDSSGARSRRSMRSAAAHSRASPPVHPDRQASQARQDRRRVRPGDRPARCDRHRRPRSRPHRADGDGPRRRRRRRRPVRSIHARA